MKRRAIKKIISAFNMIEVVLAMAIIAFGMTSILGLFPVGINAAQNAIADNCGSDAAEQFMGYLKSYAETSTTNYTGIFGTGGASGAYGEYNTPGKDLTTLRGAADTISPTFLTAFRANPVSPAAYSKIPGWQMYKSSNPAIYFVIQGAADSASYDFGAMIIVWKKAIVSNVKLDTWRQITDSNYAQGAGLNVEISWPLEKKYADREKRYYYIEIKKP